MPDKVYHSYSYSLRKRILDSSGQDVRRCQGCQLCNNVLNNEADVPLDSLIQLILVNDEEVLTCRTVWSDFILNNAQQACARDINLHAVLLALRTEAIRRGLVPHTDSTS
jgi:heterodisulfide reductase subunit C